MSPPFLYTRTYQPILKKLGVLSSFILVKEVTENIPLIYVDDMGFLRAKEYISFRRNRFLSGLKQATPEEQIVGYEFYVQYLAENFEIYDTFLMNLSILLKSIDVFYEGDGAWNHKSSLVVYEEKQKIVSMSLNNSVSDLFIEKCQFRENDMITKINDARAKGIIKIMMETSNDIYKALKDTELQKETNIA